MCRQQLRKRRSGVTLMDLVITVLIIGILSAAAAPKFVDNLHRLRVDKAAKRVQQDLGYLRQMAISKSTSLTASFMPASNEYSMTGLPGLNHRDDVYAVLLGAAPYNATLVSAALGGDSDVQFDRFGKPDSGGVITLEAGGFQETVSIDAETGKASIP